MKIGILTLHRGISYGGFLQAFALAKYLEGLGHEVEVVDYIPEHRRRFFKLTRRLKWKRGGINRGNLRAIMNLPELLRRNKAFHSAVSRHLPLSKRRYDSLEALQSSHIQLDACFFGSDQIWNPEKTGGRFDPAYFGHFGPEGMVRIAYSASFGSKGVGTARPGELRDLLKPLDRISVREFSGIEVISRFSTRTAVDTIDPTFLIPATSYLDAEIPSNLGKYVLGYFLHRSQPKLEHLERIGRELSLKLVDLDEFSKTNPFPGPLEVLALIRNAAYVVTDSFHGLALSLANKVPFTSLGLEGPAANRNERMSDLLKKVGLSDRFRTAGEFSADDGSAALPVDWQEVDAAIEGQRTIAADYIADALRKY